MKHSIALFLFLAASVAVGQDARLDVPKDPVEPGQLVQIMVVGLTDADLSKAIVDWEPQESVLVIPAKTWGGQSMILFQPPKKSPASSYAIWIAWPKAAESQGYVKARIAVEGENGPDPPKPTNPFPKPDQNWLRSLEPMKSAISQSKLSFLKAKPAAEKLGSLASQVSAGALTDNAQLFQALQQAGKEGSYGLGGDVAKALGEVMERQNSHLEPLDKSQAEWTLKYLAWSLWEYSV